MFTALTIVIPTICYVGAAYGFWTQDKPHMVVVFVGYAVANLGFIYEALR